MDPICNTSEASRASTFTARDLLIILFRHKRLMLLAFAGVLLGAVAAVLLQPPRYDASMQILVKRDRVKAVVSADPNAVTQFSSEISEEELNSEVELLRNRELLERIVLAFNLQGSARNPRLEVVADRLPDSSSEAEAARTSILSNARTVQDHTSTSQSRPATLSDSREPMENINEQRIIPASLPLRPASAATKEEISVEKAVQKLQKDLSVDVIKKTDLISVQYHSPNREISAGVLNLLGRLYLQKHVTVHQTIGAYNFFHQEGLQSREDLARAESRLLDYGRSTGVVSAATEKELTLQREAEFSASRNQTDAASAEVRNRIQLLQTQLASLSPRMTTQIRTADDAGLLAQLKVNLLTLEQRRTELLTKFEPTYRTVQEVEEQIKEAREATKAASVSKIHDETTDRDPTYQWVREELVRAQTDLVGFEARAEATSAVIKAYQQSAQRLHREEITQNDLLRDVKTAEDGYLLTVRKEEEARLSDALDRGRILNVAIEEAATVPSLPSNHRLRTFLIGLLLAFAISAGLAFAAEYFDSTFRTPDDVTSVLDIKVLAALPRDDKANAPRYAL